MVDVTGKQFEPKNKVSELINTTIYEDDRGIRYVVKKDNQSTAFYLLEQDRKKKGMLRTNYSKSLGLSSMAYHKWYRNRTIPTTPHGIKAVMDVLKITKDETIKLMKTNASEV